MKRLSVLRWTLVSACLAFGYGVCCARPARRDLHSILLDMKAFEPVYGNYVQTLHEQGAKGLQQITSPDFKLRAEGTISAGRAALRDYGKFFPGPQEKQLGVTLQQVRIAGTQAEVTLEQKVVSRPTEASQVTMSWSLRHTWRKTPQGWRLVLCEKLRRTPRLLHQPMTVTLSYPRAGGEQRD